MKSLVHDELAYSEHDSAGLSVAGSTVAVTLRRVTVSLWAIQTIADTDEGLNDVEDSFVQEGLAR